MACLGKLHSVNSGSTNKADEALKIGLSFTLMQFFE
jgi:hypothetical protein